MTAVNVAIVSGKLGQLGQLAKAGTGNDVINFTLLSVDTRAEQGTGKPRRVKEWHRITAYGDLAKTAAELAPHTVVLVQGRFQNNRRVDKGVAQHSVDIIAERIQVVSTQKTV